MNEMRQRHGERPVKYPPIRDQEKSVLWPS
jgi:hypothetical protein